VTVGQATIRTADRRRSLTAWLGPNQATLTDGVGGWSEVTRPRKPGAVEWLGTAPVKATVELLLDAFAGGGTIVTALNSARIMAPLDPATEPPVVYVSGVAVIPSTLPFVVQTLDLSDWQLRRDGQPARVTATFGLIEHRIGDVVTRSSPAKRSSSRNGTGGRGKARTYTMRKGDTLGSVAAKLLGSASRWKTLADLNRIRDPNHVKPGYVLKLPS
jgi:nucleoid-associated protein YgaU